MSSYKDKNQMLKILNVSEELNYLRVNNKFDNQNNGFNYSIINITKICE